MAFSLEIIIIAGTSGKNTMIINLKNAFEIVFRLKNLFELVFDLRYKSAFKITRGLLKGYKTSQSRIFFMPGFSTTNYSTTYLLMNFLILNFSTR